VGRRTMTRKHARHILSKQVNHSLSEAGHRAVPAVCNCREQVAV
jgi:hypothetical protein